MNLIKEIIYLIKYPGKSYRYFHYKFKQYKHYKIINSKKTDFNFPIFEQPLVSIVIPVYNQYKYTINCLYSILNTVKNIPYEIIIADDCSTDKTKEIEQHIKNIRVIKTEKNLGFLRNCNYACQFAKGKYIWLLNNDTQVLEEGLSSLLDTFSEHKDAGAVGSKLLLKNKKVQEAGGIIYSNANGWNYGRNQKTDREELNYFKEVDYCSGASLLIKKDLWNNLKGFDEYFMPVYYEETDLCFRIRENGYKVYYQPKSEIIHFESVSMKKSHKKLMKTNQKKFFDKWKHVLQNQSPNSAYNFTARDRSQGKKILVFADYGFLKPDTNCGNRSSYQYLKLFVDMGYNVKYLGVGTDKKDILYKNLISGIGVEILYYPDYEKWFKKHGIDVDYIFINRPNTWIKIETVINKYCTKAKKIYQGHDIHCIREKREARLSKDKKKFKKANKTKQVEINIWNNLDYILYYSKIEARIINKYINKNKVKVVPVYLYPDIKTDVKEYNAKERKDLIFVGSGHPPNVDAIEWFCSSIFPEIKKQLPDLRIYIVGKNVPKDLYKYQNESVIFTGYVTDEELKNLYSQVRMTVVPLRFGAGVKGKVIEAIRYNLPVITSHIGAEGIINDEYIMTIADTKEEYIEKITKLYNDYNRLNEISKKSYNFIQSHYSITRTSCIMEDILK